MLRNIIFVFIVIGILAIYCWDNFRCKHKWEQVHDTKYDNVGFRDKYPIVLVCKECGKVKVVK